MHADEKAVRARLNEVAQRYPRAEIARRVGSPGSSVSRYLSGNRIPVSFVVAVAREFAVNPAWLLFGEGAPWLDDVAAEKGRLGENLVELVQTMGRLSRLRLGSLAGKQHARQLRELSDALEHFERSREVLATHSREPYQDVLREWQAAISARDRATARRLAKAAEQVARLCPDPELQRQHQRLLAAHELLAGNVEKALAFRRRAFIAALEDGASLGESALVEAFGLVVSLERVGRVSEAERLGRAALLLARNAKSFVNYHRCLGALGWTLIQAGKMHEGMKFTTRALAGQLKPDARQNSEYALAYGLYLTGAHELAGAARQVDDSAASLSRILFLCPWSSDARTIERVLGQLAKKLGGRPTSPGQRIGLAHLYSLQGRHDAALKVWSGAEADEAARERSTIGLDFTLCAMRTQLLRMAGRQGPAVRALQQAEAARRAVAPGVMLEINWQRVHWRNVRALSKDRKQLARVEKFVRWCRRNGIHFEPAPAATPAAKPAGG
ncbi:MAG: hypothetical protein KF754_01860 [Planctomycetes bacterium]|nr:hypothetical protein [Planctomycetota bacterium]